MTNNQGFGRCNSGQQAVAKMAASNQNEDVMDKLRLRDGLLMNYK
jgi:hypothetical protein